MFEIFFDWPGASALFNLVYAALQNEYFSKMFYGHLGLVGLVHLAGGMVALTIDKGIAAREWMSSLIYKNVWASLKQRNSVSIHILGAFLGFVWAWSAAAVMIDAPTSADVHKAAASRLIFYGILVIGELILRRWQMSAQPRGQGTPTTPEAGGSGSDWKEMINWLLRLIESAKTVTDFFSILKYIIERLKEISISLEGSASSIRRQQDRIADLQDIFCKLEEKLQDNVVAGPQKKTDPPKKTTARVSNSHLN